MLNSVEIPCIFSKFRILLDNFSELASGQSKENRVYRIILFKWDIFFYFEAIKDFLKMMEIISVELIIR